MGNVPDINAHSRPESLRVPADSSLHVHSITPPQCLRTACSRDAFNTHSPGRSASILRQLFQCCSQDHLARLSMQICCINVPTSQHWESCSADLRNVRSGGVACVESVTSSCLMQGTSSGVSLNLNVSPYAYSTHPALVAIVSAILAISTTLLLFLLSSSRILLRTCSWSTGSQSLVPCTFIL